MAAGGPTAIASCRSTTPPGIDPYGHPAKIGTRLEIDPDQATWVKWIFEQYADGMSPMKIVEQLNRQGVPPPGMFYKRKSATPPTWCASALYGNVTYGLGMLNNRRYKGEVTWGRSRWPKDPDTKIKQRVLCAEQDWLTQAAEHLRIVEDDLWARVRQRQQDVHTGERGDPDGAPCQRPNGSRPEISVQRLLTCGQCGHKFVILDPTRYGCSGWKYRGLSVCTNTTMAAAIARRRALTGSHPARLVHRRGEGAVRQGNGPALEPSVNAIRTLTPAKLRRGCRRSNRRSPISWTAIKAGIFTASTKAANWSKLEAERTRLQTGRADEDRHPSSRPFSRTPLGDSRRLLTDLANVTQHQVDMARAHATDVDGKEIVLHPCADGAERYLTAEVIRGLCGITAAGPG